MLGINFVPLCFLATPLGVLTSDPVALSGSIVVMDLPGCAEWDRVVSMDWLRISGGRSVGTSMISVMRSMKRCQERDHGERRKQRKERGVKVC